MMASSRKAVDVADISSTPNHGKHDFDNILVKMIYFKAKIMRRSDILTLRSGIS